jgi:hypothetical protein
MRGSCSSVSSVREREKRAVESRKDRNRPVRERVVRLEDMEAVVAVLRDLDSDVWNHAVIVLVSCWYRAGIGAGIVSY